MSSPDHLDELFTENSGYSNSLALFIDALLVPMLPYSERWKRQTQDFRPNIRREETRPVRNSPRDHKKPNALVDAILIHLLVYLQYILSSVTVCWLRYLFVNSVCLCERWGSPSRSCFSGSSLRRRCESLWCVAVQIGVGLLTKVPSRLLADCLCEHVAGGPGCSR